VSGCGSQATTSEGAPPSRMEQSAEVRFGRSRPSIREGGPASFRAPASGRLLCDTHKFRRPRRSRPHGGRDGRKHAGAIARLAPANSERRACFLPERIDRTPDFLVPLPYATRLKWRPRSRLPLEQADSRARLALLPSNLVITDRIQATSNSHLPYGGATESIYLCSPPPRRAVT